MGVLRKKEEPTETVTVRVPSRVKAELDRLREETGAAGFDLNATLSEAVPGGETDSRRTAARERQRQRCQSGQRLAVSEGGAA